MNIPVDEDDDDDDGDGDEERRSEYKEKEAVGGEEKDFRIKVDKPRQTHCLSGRVNP